MIVIAYSLSTIVAAIIPLVTELWMLYICAFVFGFGSSVSVCGYTVWTIEMWKNKAGPFLQLNDFGFGIGSILVTVILKPYLTGELGSDENYANTFDLDHSASMSNLTNFNTGTDPSEIDRRAKLMLPTLIIGACILPSKFTEKFVEIQSD